MTSPKSDYRYVLEVLTGADDRSAPLASVPVEVNELPLARWAQFMIARRENSTSLLLDADEVSVEPRWCEKLGRPYLEGLRARVTSRQNGQYFDASTSYFSAAAKATGTKLVEQELLAKGDTFRYLVCAYPREPVETSNGAGDAGFTVETIRTPMAVRERPLDELMQRSVEYGEIEQADFPVFIPQSLLDEAVERTTSAGAEETGGILIGHLYRDPAGPELFAEVTAQIPARYAQQELTRLTFNAETWADVDTAIKLRNRQEIYLGWWHSHPARQWCKDCPIENRLRCKLSGEFFSTHDVALHETVFPLAYSIGLVISDSYANGLTWPLFGYHEGQVKQRGFQILDATPAASRVVTTS